MSKEPNRPILFKIRMYILFLVTFFLAANASAQVIAGGSDHSLAICKDSIAQTWGWNSNGELGNGTFNKSNIPVTVSFLTGIIAVTGGWNHSLALKSDGTVWSWGWNQAGQLGDGTNTDSNIPMQVTSLTGIKSIVGRHMSSLALRNDGSVWAWGRNYNGQLGNGTNADSNVPVQVSSLTGISTIEGGGGHFFALKNDGTVWAWGYNSDGQLGNGTNISSNAPVPVNSLTGITAIAGGGEYSSLALKNDSTVWSWGNNDYGQLGNGSNTWSNVPVPVSLLTGVIAIAAGGANSMALKNDGTVWIWGGGFANNIPVLVKSLSNITSIAAGSNHFLAKDTANIVWAWGGNGLGQLGNGTNTSSNVPVQVINLCQGTNAVNEISEQSDVSLYPNPSQDGFWINSSSVVVSPLQVKIMDVNGKVVYTETISQFNSEFKKYIDLGKQAKGIYFVEVISGNPSTQDFEGQSERRTKKIVLQ